MRLPQVQEVWSSNFGSVKSYTVLQTVCHRFSYAFVFYLPPSEGWKPSISKSKIEDTPLTQHC